VMKWIQLKAKNFESRFFGETLEGIERKVWLSMAFSSLMFHCHV